MKIVVAVKSTVHSQFAAIKSCFIVTKSFNKREKAREKIKVYKKTSTNAQNFIDLLRQVF